MSLGNVQTKKIMLSLLIFGVGAFSVSIANILKGYFASVIVIEFVALTIYLNYLLEEKNAFKNNLINIILISIVVVSNLVFFVVNDIVGKDVYVGNLGNFWDVSVVTSQLISLAALVYNLIMFVLRPNVCHIEVIEGNNESHQQNSNYTDNAERKEVVEKTINEPIKESIESDDDEANEVKSISEKNVKYNPPFMEEEN